MRASIFAVLLLLAGSVPVGASKEDVRIRAVISAQIEAFRNDDGAAAFAIASPDIQAKFGSPGVFLHVVASAYPQVYRPKNVVFLELSEATGRLLQHVLITGPKGRIVLALYEMQNIDGKWRINGCRLTDPPGKAI